MQLGGPGASLQTGRMRFRRIDSHGRCRSGPSSFDNIVDDTGNGRSSVRGTDEAPAFPSACCRALVTQQCGVAFQNFEEVDMAKAKSPIPEGFHTVTPQLTL